MDLQLHGKRAIISGATRGLGRAIGEELLREGVKFAFCARNAGAVAEAEAAYAARGGKARAGVGPAPRIGPHCAGTARDGDGHAGKAKAEAGAPGLDPQFRPAGVIAEKSAATRQIRQHPCQSSGKQALAALYVAGAIWKRCAAEVGIECRNPGFRKLPSSC